jgi:hypothetical protein
MNDRIIMTLLVLAMGILIGLILQTITFSFIIGDGESKNVLGFYIYNSSISQINELVTTKRYSGDWICVDMKDTKNLDDAVMICSHEIAHHIYKINNNHNYSKEESEIFAEEMEDKFEVCEVN